MARHSWTRWLTGLGLAVGALWFFGRKAPAGPPGGQTIYPVDDWIVETAQDGTQSIFRPTYLLAGYSGGLLMSRGEAFIRFTGLPAVVAQATLEISLIEYLGANPYSADISIGGQVVATDTASPPATVRVDVTGLVNAVAGGDLLVNITPQLATENFLRRYGSVRNASVSARPRVVVA